MKKQLLLFAFALGAAFPLAAQSFNDNHFRNVIEIEDRDVFTNGTDFLFKRAVPAVQKPVVFVSASLPPHLLPTLYPEFPELIVMMPNYPYYQQVAESTPPGMCAEPIRSTLLYERVPGPRGAQVRERVLEGEHPELEMQPVAKVPKGFLKVYLTETYASETLPKTGPEAFIRLFENQSGHKIKGVYTAKTGNRTTFYYTLEGMPDAARLPFLKARQAVSSPGAALYHYQKQAVFTPRLIPVPGTLREWHLQ